MTNGAPAVLRLAIERRPVDRPAGLPQALHQRPPWPPVGRGRRLERASVPRSVAMKLTGHKTESVYRRYAIVSEVDLAEGLGRLGR